MSQVGGVETARCSRYSICVLVSLGIRNTPCENEKSLRSSKLGRSMVYRQYWATINIWSSHTSSVAAQKSQVILLTYHISTIFVFEFSRRRMEKKTFYWRSWIILKNHQQEGNIDIDYWEKRFFFRLSFTPNSAEKHHYSKTGEPIDFYHHEKYGSYPYGYAYDFSNSNIVCVKKWACRCGNTRSR